MARLVIAGIGLVGRRHASAIAASKDAELVGIVDPSDEGRSYAQSNGLPWYASLETMFAADRPDGVILSSPTPLHVEQGMTCVEYKCAVLVEKPLAVASSDAFKLVKAAEDAGVELLVGHHRRHNPLIQKASEIITDGRIGQVRSVHANCWFYKPDHYFDVAPWRKLKGAGPISVNLVHDVDLIRYLCGEVVSVQAQARPSSRGFENEDVAAAVLKFKSGAIGTISVSDSVVAPWSWEMTSGENPIYDQTNQSCYNIGGSLGALSVPDLKLWSHGAVPDWWSPIAAEEVSYDSSDPLANQIAHFVEVIEGRVKPLVSGREGLRTLQVVEAIQTAAATGDTVHIADLNDIDEFNEAIERVG